MRKFWVVPIAALVVIAAVLAGCATAGIGGGWTHFTNVETNDMNVLDDLVVGDAATISGSISSGVGGMTFTDNVFIDGQADANQLVVQGYATQTNSLLVLENSAGVDQLVIDGSGQVSSAAGAISVTDNVYLAGTADLVQLTVRGYTTQTSNIFVVENSSGVNAFQVNAAGNTAVTGVLNPKGAIQSTDGAVTVTDGIFVDGQAAGVVGVLVQSHATPNVDVLVVESSAGSDVFNVSHAGNVTAAGTLNVVGAVDLDGALNLDGNLSSTSGGVTVTDGLVVEGASDLQGPVSSSAGGVTVTDNVIITGTMNVYGNINSGVGGVTLTDSLRVTGDSTFVAAVSIGTFLRAAKETAIAVTMDSYITPTGTLQQVTAVGACATANIAAGTDGDILILLNSGAQTITISDTGTLKLSGNIALTGDDILMLVSNGTNWYEIAHIAN